MRVVSIKYELVFELKNSIQAKREIPHTQRMVLYPVAKNRQKATQELYKQAEQFGKTYYFVELVEEVRRNKCCMEVKIKWLGWEDNDATWEPPDQIRNDVLGLLKDLLHSAGRRNLNRTVLDVLF